MKYFLLFLIGMSPAFIFSQSESVKIDDQRIIIYNSLGKEIARGNRFEVFEEKLIVNGLMNNGNEVKIMDIGYVESAKAGSPLWPLLTTTLGGATGWVLGANVDYESGGFGDWSSFEYAIQGGLLGSLAGFGAGLLIQFANPMEKYIINGKKEKFKEFITAIL